MNTHRIASVEAAWSRLGVLLPVEPQHESPDLERLLLETVRQLPTNARLFQIAVTWLATFGGFVAKHRLKRLVITELERESQPVLGLLLETAIRLGSPQELDQIAEVCHPSELPRPLFKSQQSSPAVSSLAESNASALSRKWGVWAPEIDLKRGVIRPVGWVLKHNKDYRDRIVRKGDLRCSIIETLRRDTNGEVPSEAELARLCGASRHAIRKSLEALKLEGDIEDAKKPGSARNHAVSLAA